MMHANTQSTAASAITLRQMGMHGKHLAGPLDKGKLQQIGIDAGTAFLSSGFDVDKLYDPSFQALSVLALALPPPLDSLASLGITGIKVGTDAVRNAMKEAFRAAGRYLPVSVSQQVTAALSKSPTTYWSAAARDKFAQGASSNFVSAGAIALWNANADEENKLNVSVHTRLADRVYNLAISKKAAPWQAATAAYSIASTMGATPAECSKWASIILKNLSDMSYATNSQMVVTYINSFADAELAWKQLVGEIGGAVVSAAQAAKLPPAGTVAPPPGSSSGSNTALLVAGGAVGVLALALLLRGRSSAPAGGTNV